MSSETRTCIRQPAMRLRCPELWRCGLQPPRRCAPPRLRRLRLRPSRRMQRSAHRHQRGMALPAQATGARRPTAAPPARRAAAARLGAARRPPRAPLLLRPTVQSLQRRCRLRWRAALRALLLRRRAWTLPPRPRRLLTWHAPACCSGAPGRPCQRCPPQPRRQKAPKQSENSSDLHPNRSTSRIATRLCEVARHERHRGVERLSRHRRHARRQLSHGGRDALASGGE